MTIREQIKSIEKEVQQNREELENVKAKLWGDGSGSFNPEEIEAYSRTCMKVIRSEYRYLLVMRQVKFFNMDVDKNDAINIPSGDFDLKLEAKFK